MSEHPFTGLINLAQPRLGAAVVFASDDFFADKSRLISPLEPIFVPGKYDDNGKWMDGWESRRKRGPGHDHCIIRLGVPGVIRGFDIDTRHFTGNYPPSASIDGCVCAAEIPPADVPWQSLVAPMPLSGDSQHLVVAHSEQQFTHLRLNIYPDGGVARLRVFGEVRPDWHRLALSDEAIDLLAMAHGGRALACNDEHFGSMHNLTALGRGVDMGDGWETRRRRSPGNDWAILALGCAGTVERVLIDTAHFKGNYPDRASLQAVHLGDGSEHELAAQSLYWETLLPEAKLNMDAEHEFADTLRNLGPITHVRLNIFPDGGISRLRLFGRPA